MTQDKDQMRAEFEDAYWDAQYAGKCFDQPKMRAELFKKWTGGIDSYYLTAVENAFRGWKLAYQAARASAPQGVPEPGWWRKRADEIELEVARTGSKEAMRCFTDMRTLLQAAAAPQGVPMNVRIAMLSALEGSSDALFEAGKDNKDAEAALDWLAAAPQPVAQKGDE